METSTARLPIRRWLPRPGTHGAEVEFAERFVADAPSLDITAEERGGIGAGPGPISLREVLLEMIHEYARHLGHADLLRERIDGRIGQ